MATFPTIYVHGTLAHTPVARELEETIAQDPTIRNQFDGGYVRTRAKFTRIVRRWSVRFEGVSTTNKETIRDFENNAKTGAGVFAGIDYFTWTNPADSTPYSVRFVGVVRYVPWGNTNFGRWNIEFVLEQL